MSTLLERLEQTYASLQTIFRSTLGPRATAVIRRTEAGATLEEVQGEIDAVRAEFDSIYAQVQSLRDQAVALDERPDIFIAQLDQSLNVNRNNNYQALGRAVTRAGQNTNKLNQDIAAKAQADQGSGAQSAGAETSEEQRARAEAASTQNPRTGSEQQSGTGAISASPPTAVPTNAESSQPAAVPEVPNAPPAAVVAAPAAGDQLPGTPAQGRGALQPPVPSGAQRFYIYKAIMVTSNFSGGRFTQDLEGLLLQIPVTGARRQDDVLVPTVQTSATESDVLPGFTTDSRAAGENVGSVLEGGAAPNVIPDNQTDAQAPPGDATVYGPAETAPPDSDGEPVPVATPAAQPQPVTTLSANFTLQRDGRPLQLEITATFSARTNEVFYDVTSASGNVLAKGASFAVVDRTFSDFARQFPADSEQIRAAQSFLVSSRQQILQSGVTPADPSAGRAINLARET